MEWRLKSAIEGVAWPAVPDYAGAVALYLLAQLESSQWQGAGRLLELQLRQLEALLRHAWETVPYYREEWAGRFDPAAPVSPESLSRLPLLTRRALQTRREELRSHTLPAGHGEVFEASTSGSSGAPVRLYKTEVAELFWRVITLREHLWHKRDLTGRLAAIRSTGDVGEFEGWGAATHGIVATGPSLVMGVGRDIPDLLGELERWQPDYLLTHPTILRELLRQSAARGLRLPRLREVRTFAELFLPGLREACGATWGVPVTDVYSTAEVGYVALQCPKREHYHVQSEDVFVEILNEDGEPCGVGEVGRVVVTALHNFATPLIRYDIGDYAERGGPCPCGRGLPVLRRIAGRSRNMLVTAGGQRLWPSLGAPKFHEIAEIDQYQFAQTAYDLVELRLVAAGRLTAAQEQALRARVLEQLPSGFQLRLVYRERIARGAGGKFEDFVCEISDG